MSYLPPQVYASDVLSSWWERQRQAEGLGAFASMIEGMRPGSAAPDGRFGIMKAYGVVLCPGCRAGVVRGSMCRGCARVVA